MLRMPSILLFLVKTSFTGFNVSSIITDLRKHCNITARTEFLMPEENVQIQKYLIYYDKHNIKSLTSA